MGGLGQRRGVRGGNGKGPGGSEGSVSTVDGASGAGYGVVGETQGGGSRGTAYGSVALQPLLGGSGGGSGRAPSTSARVTGFAGGSGAGAILIAVSGTLSINGSVVSIGGDAEDEREGLFTSTMGGGGSGGGIRIVATEFSGAGIIDVSGGKGGTSVAQNLARANGANGGYGRLRVESDTFTFTGELLPPGITIPILPQPIFLAEIPSLKIVSVAGVIVPASPTGINDIVLPSDVANPVTVEFEATGVPVDTTVNFTLTPESGEPTSVTSGGLVGTGTLTSNITVTLAEGASTMLASLAFIVTETQSVALSQYTNGEKVRSVSLVSSVSGGSKTILTTFSGRLVDISTFVKH